MVQDVEGWLRLDQVGVSTQGAQLTDDDANSQAKRPSEHS